uniref:Putative ovule protein n=1 Tax=Solanum chacoense TaxID=4108 RepID=A0A0V0H3A8_SOLCH
MPEIEIKSSKILASWRRDHHAYFQLKVRDLIIGKNTPPAFAAVLGIAGAIKASLRANPYDKPGVLFSNHLTKYVAIRSAL